MDALREVCGPKKTHYNRFVRRAEKGIWTGLFEALARAEALPAQALLASALKAHRCVPRGNGWSKVRQ